MNLYFPWWPIHLASHYRTPRFRFCALPFFVIQRWLYAIHWNYMANTFTLRHLATGRTDYSYLCFAHCTARYCSWFYLYTLFLHMLDGRYIWTDNVIVLCLMPQPLLRRSAYSSFCYWPPTLNSWCLPRFPTSLHLTSVYTHCTHKHSVSACLSSLWVVGT